MELFKLFAGAERINSVYHFDPLFAVNCSIVDPLPHQVEAVYKFLCPHKAMAGRRNGRKIQYSVYPGQQGHFLVRSKCFSYNPARYNFH